MFDNNIIVNYCLSFKYLVFIPSFLVFIIVSWAYYLYIYKNKYVSSKEN